MNTHSPAEILGIVLPVVLEAGEMLSAAMQRDERVEVEHKGRVDLVTAVDRQLQEKLVTDIGASFESDAMVAEEAEAHEADLEGAVWYVDPLDGTTNFVHGHPFVSISVARFVAGRAQVAVVYAPALDELFTATDGGGAWLERPRTGEKRRALHGSGCGRLQDALLATGFPYQRGRIARLNLTCCAHVLHRCHGVRRAGSAALDLCYLAAGRLDGFWEMTLSPWDVAAGSLIAREAGMTVTDFLGGPDFLWGRRVCASAPAIHAELRGLLSEAHARPEASPLGEPWPGSVPLTQEEDDA